MDGISSSSARPTRRWTYDVFLSFRGEDTRNNFVDHLYAALDRAGIYTFKDDEKLQRGEPISPELVTAIQDSMVAVVVFSKKYADSCWCLEELAQIIECHDIIGQRVLPVFYDVEPSDVRGQKRGFQTAFEEHQVQFIDDMDKVNRWREALKTAANLSGWDVIKTANGREAECIKLIVKNISGYIRSNPAENLIGMESRVEHVKSLLGKGSVGDVCIIGIWGMGGIGKTTIARAVYHQISYQFEGSSFVGNVRENSSDNKDLKSLQEKLLSEILLEKDFKVKDCDDGVCQIRRRLGRKKVLVVLDDVDDMKQLEFLASAREWFGHDSRIMITTRDEHLLSYAQEKYEPELLTRTQAMKLFSRYAFKANTPPKEYAEVSSVVVDHTGHLPLALKVLGSYFCGRRNLEFWKSSLKVLDKIPNKEINGILKLSYNGLNILEKKIFLHIACFFKGLERGYITRILDFCGFEAVSGITVLIEKSLLTISKSGKLHMHDLIQEMGRWIVREYHPYTMVWVQEEFKEVMATNDKLEIVEAMVETEDYDDRYSPEVFKSMKKLILLHVYGEFTSSEPTYFPEELRWVCWSNYPFQSLKITRGMTKLVGLEVSNSPINQLRIENQDILTNLKFMNLSESWEITSFPDISGVPNLEVLNLSFCQSLVKVHQSVLLHRRIIHLNLSACDSLKFLASVIKMESLQSLSLKGCENLEIFPEVTMEMRRLLLLNMYGCKRIRVLPLSIKLFTGLITFIMGKDRFSRSGILTSMPRNKQHMQGFKDFTCLRILDLQGNDLVEEDFRADLHNAWTSLEELDLSDNLFIRIPSTISYLSHLKYLDVSRCINLRELKELPPLIQLLKADNCILKKIGDLSNKYKRLFNISLFGCHELLDDHESRRHIANMLMKPFVLKCAALNHRLSIFVPGSKIPNWFTNQQLGNKIPLNLQQNQITKIMGLAVCCLFSQSSHTGPIWLDIKFKVSCVQKLVNMPASLAKSAESSECVWIGYMSTDFLRILCQGLESQDLIISFESLLCDVVQCGMCVIYKDDIKPVTTIRSWIPDFNELDEIDHGSAINDDFLRGRWSFPTFSMVSHKKCEVKV